MPRKKKKFDSRFPPARVKKIMQSDEEVGKVAIAVPVIVSRALEQFITGLIIQASNLTIEKKAKTLVPYHIKQTIESNKLYDFLHGLVSDISLGDDGEMPFMIDKKSSRNKGKITRKLKISDDQVTSDESTDCNDDESPSFKINQQTCSSPIHASTSRLMSGSSDIDLSNNGAKSKFYRDSNNFETAIKCEIDNTSIIKSDVTQQTEPINLVNKITHQFEPNNLVTTTTHQIEPMNLVTKTTHTIYQGCSSDGSGLRCASEVHGDTRQSALPTHKIQERSLLASDIGPSRVPLPRSPYINSQFSPRFPRMHNVERLLIKEKQRNHYMPNFSMPYGSNMPCTDDYI